MTSRSNIGVAIATFNSSAVIRACLLSLGSTTLHVVIFDDGSTDDTVAIARSAYPSVEILHGDGSNWWAGGTRRAVEHVLAAGCDYVVMLNPDVQIDGRDIQTLVKFVENDPMVIAAPLVVDQERPDQVAWAGSKFGKLRFLPIFTSSYVQKRGSATGSLGDTPYEVDEAHGRGVVLSRALIDHIGMLDSVAFPHYGADNDYSLRARSKGVRIVVLPTIHARLEVRNSGMEHGSGALLEERLRGIHDYLFERKHGDALRVWWKLLNRHVPRYAVVPSFAFNIGLNILRRVR